MLGIKKIFHLFARSRMRSAALLGIGLLALGLGVLKIASATGDSSAEPLTGLTISGRAITTGGVPISAAAIAVSGDADGFMLTDGNGTFSFPNMPPAGTFLVTATKEDFVFSPESFEILNLQHNMTVTFVGTCFAPVCPTFTPTPTSSPTPTASPSPADKSLVWNGSTTGVWTDAFRWLDGVNPSANFPNNGKGGFTYDANFPNGELPLDQNITIQKFSISGGSDRQFGNLSNFTLTVNDLFTWGGGFIKDTGIIQANGGISLIGNTNHFLTSRTINNTGTANWTAGSVNSGIGAIFNNSGTFDTDFDGSFVSDQGGTQSQFNNIGTFTKSGGTGSTTFTSKFNNFGTVNACSGTIAFNGGGITTGPVVLGACLSRNEGSGGGDIKFDGGTFDFGVGGSITGDRTVTVNSGTVNFNSGSTFDITGTTNVAGGHLVFGTTTFARGNSILETTANTGQLIVGNGSVDGTGTLSVTNPFTWSGGTLQGTGTLIANGGMILNGTGKTLLQRILNNPDGQTASWTSGPFATGQGAVFNNAGIFDTNFDGDFNHTQGGVMTVFNNSGSFIKSGVGGGSGQSIMNVIFNNTGTVTASAGTMTFDNGYYGGCCANSNTSTSTGNWVVNSGAIINFGGGTHNLNGGTISGDGTIRISSGFHTGIVNFNGGTYNVTGTTRLEGGDAYFNAPATTGQLQLILGVGRLRGNGSTLTVNGLFTYNAGDIYNSGIIQANGGLLFNGAGTIYSRTINNNNNNPGATWTGGSFNWGQGAVFNNLTGASFDAQTDGTFTNNDPGAEVSVFNNAGSFTKSLGTGTTDMSIPFNNSGSVEANIGTISFNNGGSSNTSTSTGSFAANSGATINFGAGTHNLNAGSSVSGTGTIRFSSGFNNGTTFFNGGTYNVAGTTTIQGASVTFNIPATFGQLNHVGGLSYLRGNGSTLTVNGMFTWDGGLILDAGTINANGGMTLRGGQIQSRMVNNAAGQTANWVSGGFGSGFGAVFENNGTFDIQCDSSFNSDSGGTRTQFTNVGLLKKTAGAGISNLGFFLNNTGTVNAISGTMSLDGGSASTGNFDIASGATIKPAGNFTYDFNAGSTVTGAGIFNSANGAVSFNAGSTFNFGGTLIVDGSNTYFTVPGTTQQLNVLSGRLWIMNSSTFTVTGLATWSRDEIRDNGTLQANGGMLINGGNHTLLQATINNPAGQTAMWTSGNVSTGQGAVFNNAGIFDTTHDGEYNANQGGATQFNNSGTLTKSGGSGTTTFPEVTFNNTGTVNVNSGTLSLNGQVTNTGSFAISSGSTLRFGGNFTSNFNSGNSFTGTGTVHFANGLVRFNAGSIYNFPGTTLTDGGYCDFRIPASTEKLIVGPNGRFYNHNGDTFTVNGLFTWQGGYVFDSGVLQANGGMAITGGTGTMLSITINNAAGQTATWTGGNISTGQGTVFNNAGTFDTTHDGTYNADQGGATQFNNSGTFTKSGGSGNTTFQGVPFNNTGIVNANSGTIVFNGGYSQTAGTIILNGNNVAAGTINLNGGQVVGIGIVNGGLNNNNSSTAPGFSGAVTRLLNAKGYRPAGSSIGTITVSSTLTYNSGSSYDCEIDSSTLAADKIAANGVSITSGTISITDLGNGKPLGTVFTIIDNTSGGPISGVFSNLPDNSWTIINGNTYKVNYSGGNGNDLTLTFAAVAGTVTYGNPLGNPTPPRYVSNVTITAAGSPTVSTVTGAPGPNAGTYLLTAFLGGAYTFTPTKTGGVNNAINSFDAAKVAQHAAGISPLNANQLIVADVSNNGSVNSFDAAKIAQFVAGVTPLPSPNLSGSWKFLPASNVHTNIGTSITGENYTAYLMGEVSGNWNNTGARPTKMRGPEKISTVQAPKIVVPADTDVSIPLEVKNVQDKGVISYEFDLRYDPSVIQPQLDPVELAKTVSSKLAFVANDDEPGLLRVVVYGPLPVDEDGTLLVLKFTAVGAPGSVSPLTLDHVLLNEGDPPVTLNSGRIELSDAPPETATITGRLLTSMGQGVPDTRVLLTDAKGRSRFVFSNRFGNYRFGGLHAGETYIIGVASPSLAVTPMTVSVTSQSVSIDLIAD